MPDDPRRPLPAPLAAEPVAGESVPGSNTLPHAYSRASQSDCLSFLAPARAEGELGWLGHYRVLKLIGRGGMGMVFQAEDTKLQRRVALKVMLPEYAADEQARERFLREARAAAAVENSYVVTIHAVDEANGTPFIAMELLKGMTLEAYLHQHGVLRVGQALRIARQMADGLAAAHAKGLIHRDIKPANVWLEAPSGRVKLLDFGLARQQEDHAHLTGNIVIGTPAYMSPEQARALPLDARSDLFSLGTVIYHTLAGQMPFHGDTAQAMLCAVLVDRQTPVNVHNPQVPPALAALVDRLLAKDPAHRPGSAREVVQALRALEKPALAQVADTVPIAAAVEVPEENVFAGITEAELTPIDMVPAAAEPLEPARRRLWIPITGIAVVIAAVIIASVSKRSSAPTVVEKKGGETKVVQVPKPVVDPKKDPPKKEDATRRAGEWVRKVKGTLTLKQAGAVLLPEPGEALPGQPFEIIGIDLENNKDVDDAGLENLRGLKDLELLDLSGTEISTRALAILSEFPNLDTLYLRNVPVTDEIMGRLKGLHLDALEVNSNEVTDAGLDALDGMSLRSLIVVSSRLTNQGLSKLAGLSNLRFLALASNRLSDAGLKELPAFPRLERLHLAGTALGDGAAEFAARLPKLKDLTLESVKPSESAVKKLGELKGLTRMSFKDVKVSDDALKSFRTARPECLTLVDGHQDPAGPFPPLDAEWLKKTRALSPAEQVAAVEKELKRRHPEADVRLSYRGATSVSNITVQFEGLTDLTPFRAFPRLVVLDLSNGTKDLLQPRLATLEPLRGMDLKSFSVQGAPFVDLRPLAGMRLSALSLAGCGVRDLKTIEDMPLKILLVCGCPVADLSPIGTLSNLETLCIGTHLPGTTIDAAALLKLSSLSMIVAPDDSIQDINALRKHPALNSINSKKPEQYWKEREARTADPDRWAAEKLANLGTEIAWRQGDKTGLIVLNSPLPKDAFEITGIRLSASVPIKDSLVEFCAGLKNLTEVRFSELARSDLLFHYLRSIPMLKSLELGSTPLCNQDLERLAEIRTLKMLAIAAGKLTPESIKAFQSALPDCTLTIDGQSATAWLKKQKAK